MAKKKQKRKQNAGFYAIERAKQRGADFLRRIGKTSAADALEDESVEHYAQRKGLLIENPRKKPKAKPARKKPRAKIARKKPRVKGLVKRRANARKKKNGIGDMLRKVGILKQSSKKPATKKAAARRGDDDDPTPGSTEWYHKTRKQLPHKRAAGAKHPMTKTEFDTFFENARGRGWNPRKKKNAKPARKKRAIKTSQRAKARRRNGDMSGAESMYAKFHGRQPGEIIEIMEKDVARKEYAALGSLDKLEVDGKHCIVFNEKDGVLLACDPDGKQLYIIGGNQNIAASLDELGVDKSKDLVDVGECTQIEYFTRKKFDNFQPIVYFHQFGEETGVCPRLMYNQLNKRLHLVGGEYKIKKEGIIN